MMLCNMYHLGRYVVGFNECLGGHFRVTHNILPWWCMVVLVKQG